MPVNIDVGQPGQGSSELIVVLLLLRMKPEVFKE
jgi:hypothetical protein